MKILEIIKSVNPADGGTTETVKQVGTSLVAAGHGVEVLSLDSPSAPHLKHYPLPVHPLGPARFKYGFNNRLIPSL